jgi:choline dehydrogenase-like flavoprotein
MSELKRSYDAIIIGTGPGGSSLAYKLTKLGLRILVVERGKQLRPDPNDRSASIGRYVYDVAKKDEALSFVGGASKFYGSALYRLRETDFEAVEHERGASPAWPITYSEIEPYYLEGETLYRVHGSSVGDPTEPAREQPFPYPPIEHSRLVRELVDRLARNGTNVSFIPLGLDFRPGGRCVLCSTCDAYYCKLDAKMDAEIAALRPALATGNVELVTETECVRVNVDAAGKRVEGVLLRRKGEELTVHSEIVAVCAGLPHSALLLWRSRTDAHPSGLGNAGGALGRYLGGHSVGMIFPFVGWKPVPAVYTKTFAINQFYNGAPDWPYPLGVVQVAGLMPFWENAPPAIRRLARAAGKRFLMTFYMTEALPTRSSGIYFDGDEVVSRTPPIHNLQSFSKLRKVALGMFRQAGYPALALRRPPYVWHEVGTARFGLDPSTSVADPNCQVHGIRGLYVVDASVLPSAGAVNTGLTIIALALRAGAEIAMGSKVKPGSNLSCAADASPAANCEPTERKGMSGA